MFKPFVDLEGWAQLWSLCEWLKIVESKRRLKTSMDALYWVALYPNSRLPSNHLLQPLAQQASTWTLYLQLHITARHFSWLAASLNLLCGTSTRTHLALTHGNPESAREITLYKETFSDREWELWVEKCSSLLFLWWTILKHRIFQRDMAESSCRGLHCW